MDNLLSRPAEEVYFHEVMPLFREVTMKSRIDRTESYEQFIDNFGVELLLKTDGDIGWDVFCLNYIFPPDIKSVVDKHMELMLQRLNIFLLKLRRVQARMNDIWLKMKQVIKANDTLKTCYNLVLKCNYFRTQMYQFISNLNSYIFYEVIASEYQNFVEQVSKCQSLPHLREITFNFLSNLLCKCYIQAPPVELDREKGASGLGRKQLFYPSKASNLYPRITKLLSTLDLFIQTYE